MDEDVLRREFNAEEGSFLLRLRCDLVWDVNAFRQLTRAMFAFLRSRDPERDVPRWAAEGFWYASWFVKSWSEHPSFPRPLPRSYYDAACERLHDLAFWLFTGACPYTNPATLEKPLPGEDPSAEAAHQVLLRDDIAAFISRAQEFCSFVERAKTLPLAERLATARLRLSALYTAAIALPHVEASEESLGERSSTTPIEWAGFEAREAYWEVFDPYELTQPVAGSLSDDLLDIHRDLRRGLAHWSAGAKTTAVWEWRFSFDTHWGDHAVDALRALHRACVG